MLILYVYSLPCALLSCCRYISYEELPNSAVPYGVKYMAGWGYVLSRDLAAHAVAKVDAWEQRPEIAPAWFK